MTSAAIYARYSSDHQRDTSIDDQVRNCEEWAKKNNCLIISTFSDRAVSGTRQDREGYQAAITAGLSGLFSVLLVDDLSRLGRDMVDRENTIRRLELAGVRLVGVSDGYDSDQGEMARRLQRGAKGLLDDLYLVDLAHKTHRGLTGVFLQGKSAGGRSYGYTSKPIEHPTRTDQYDRPLIEGAYKEINPDQARVVRYIFEQYAAGWSCKRIAAELNDQGVPGPRSGTWSRSTIYGDRKRPGIGILNNTLYMGLYQWNRSKWIKDPDNNNHRRRIERPVSEWETQDAPDLAIIDRELWDRVKARQARQAQRNGGGRPNNYKYILSGVLKCGVCGSNYSMVNRYSLGCAGRTNRGKSHCNNALLVSRKLAETRILQSVKNDLLSGEAISYYQKSLARALRDQNKTINLVGLKRRRKKAETEIANLLSAIKAGIVTTSTKAALQAAETEIEGITAQLAQIENRPPVAAMLPRAVDKYRAIIEGLEGRITDVGAARVQIQAIIGDSITLQPAGDHLVAEVSPAGVLVDLARSTAGGASLGGSGGALCTKLAPVLMVSLAK